MIKNLLIYISFAICNNLEYAILYDSSLEQQALSISDLYNNQIDEDFRLTTQTFSNLLIESLYNEQIFALNVKSFISDLSNDNPDLKYVLILGDEDTFPPIYLNNISPSDDFYISDNTSLSIPSDISFGRIPSSDSILIDNFVEKLTIFLTQPTLGIWRDTAVLVADDEFKNASNQACEIKHTTNSDVVYNILSEYMDVKTLYGIDYQAEATADGLSHVELNQDLINQINNGVALINYIGHGDQRSLSAEKIIDMQRDLNQISISNNKLGIWVVGTCKFGQYDNEVCMAEKLITDENAAIGVISTVRSVSSTFNIDFLENLFSQYIQHFESPNVLRLGDIITAAKLNTFNSSTNYQGYLFHLFGDPALPIFSSKKIQNELVLPDTISIGLNYNLDMPNYDYGDIIVKYNDNLTEEMSYGQPTSFCPGSVVYNVPGNILFKNQFNDEICLSLPIDAANCIDCNGKAHMYFQNEGSYNGVSQIKNEILIKYDDSQLEIFDETGPNINFKKNNFNLVDNTIIKNNTDLTVELNDESGINIYNGIGHNFRYWFNDELDSYNVPATDFNYTNACKGEGNLNLTIPNRYIGDTRLNFEAWDNFNNSTTEYINLHILSENNKQIISNFLNLPNPFKNNTHFTFQITDVNLLPLDIDFLIFDMNGKIVKNISVNDINNQFHSITWNGTNNSNEIIPNGNYILRALITSSDGTKQQFNKVLSKMK